MRTGRGGTRWALPPAPRRRDAGDRQTQSRRREVYLFVSDAETPVTAPLPRWLPAETEAGCGASTCVLDAFTGRGGWRDRGGAGQGGAGQGRTCCWGVGGSGTTAASIRCHISNLMATSPCARVMVRVSRPRRGMSRPSCPLRLAPVAGRHPSLTRIADAIGDSDGLAKPPGRCASSPARPPRRSNEGQTHGRPRLVSGVCRKRRQPADIRVWPPQGATDGRHPSRHAAVGPRGHLGPYGLRCESLPVNRCPISLPYFGRYGRLGGFQALFRG